MRYVLLSLLLLSSCAFPELAPEPPPEPVKPTPAPAPAPVPVIDPNFGFIYGRITVNGKKPSLISLDPQNKEQKAGGKKPPYRINILEDGSYFAENVPPGRYFLNFEVSGVRIPVPQKSDFAQSGVSETKEIEISPEEFHFMGALRMSLMEKDEVYSGQSAIQSFQLDFDETPGDVELLNKLLKEPALRQGAWATRIRKEIRRLNSKRGVGTQ